MLHRDLNSSSKLLHIISMWSITVYLQFCQEVSPSGFSPKIMYAFEDFTMVTLKITLF